MSRSAPIAIVKKIAMTMVATVSSTTPAARWRNGSVQPQTE